MNIKIENSKVFNTDKRVFEKRTLYFNEKFTDKMNTDKTVDGNGLFAIPGFIDIHTHGRAGIDIMKATPNELSVMSVSYAKSGVTTLFPTVMTATIENIEKAIENIKAATCVAHFDGIHIEGPYISFSKPGCHDTAFIKKPTVAELSDLYERIKPLRFHITIAPECDSDGCIAYLADKGATVGIGHTGADSAQTLRALADGANCFTHTFNAMPPFSHRAPGPVGVALASDAYAEFICDGFHLDMITVMASYNAKKRFGDKFVLITDSIPQTGLPDGQYDMNNIKFSLSGGHAVSKTGTIIGSTLDMCTAVKNLVLFCGITYEEAIICATKAPAQAVGIYDEVGSIETGKRADLLLCNMEGGKLNVVSVFCSGKQII